MDDGTIGIIIIIFMLLIVVGIIVGFVFLGKKSKERNDEAELKVSQIASSLPADKQGLFMMQYQNIRKNPTLAVWLALLLGGVGAHKFYMGNTVLGIVYILFSWTLIPAIVSFVEAFTIAGKVGEYNEQQAARIASVFN